MYKYKHYIMFLEKKKKAKHQHGVRVQRHTAQISRRISRQPSSQETFETIQAHVSSMAAAVAAANTALLHQWSDSEQHQGGASYTAGNVNIPANTSSSNGE